MKPLWQQYIRILQRDVVPALGCTEPLAVALPSAHCRRLLGRMPTQITAYVSGNIFKNGMGVGVPGTGMVGLRIAAAIGAVAGDADAGLEVLRSVRPQDVDIARDLLGAIDVEVKEGGDPIYAEVVARAGEDIARVVICGGHTRIVLKELNGRCIYSDAGEDTGEHDHAPAPDMNIELLVDFATNAPLEAISFMSEAVRLNSALSDEGLEGEYGLRVGATLYEQVQQGLLSDDLITLAMRISSAASDARMDGAMLPAMSNSGSGNQGISATMPVVAAARMIGADAERLVRAVTLSHIVAIYIKSHQHALSALCAVSTAAMGSGAAITWLLGGDGEAIAACIQNMIGDVAGIICDGAKTSCSMKVSTAAAAAVKAALLAKKKIRVGADEGIVAESVDATIANLGELSRRGMVETDREIIRIMIDKARANDAAAAALARVPG
jgi:L-cysteine desulfidase